MVMSALTALLIDLLKVRAHPLLWAPNENFRQGEVRPGRD